MRLAVQKMNKEHDESNNKIEKTGIVGQEIIKYRAEEMFQSAVVGYSISSQQQKVTNADSQNSGNKQV